MITKFKIFEESEVSSGNATGKAGTPSIPFGRGYYSVGNNGEFGIAFTPSVEKNIKTYKGGKHSKKDMRKKNKKKEFLNKEKSEQILERKNFKLYKQIDQYIFDKYDAYETSLYEENGIIHLIITMRFYPKSKNDILTFLEKMDDLPEYRLENAQNNYRDSLLKFIIDNVPQEYIDNIKIEMEAKKYNI